MEWNLGDLVVGEERIRLDWTLGGGGQDDRPHTRVHTRVVPGLVRLDKMLPGPLQALPDPSVLTMKRPKPTKNFFSFQLL